MKYLAVLLIFFLLLGCDSTRVYEDFNDMEESFWHIDSVQTFTFEIQDTSKAVNVLATFRNGSAYPFYNLYFQYSLMDSTQAIVDSQLEQYHFFDAITGEPLGSGLGDLFDHSVVLIEDYKFSASGSYTLQLQQFMRMDTLPFILSVGARVEFVE